LTAPNQAVFTAECDALRTFGTAYTIAFSADGKYLAAGIKPMVNIWDWKNQKLLHSLPGHNFHTIPVAFSSDGRLATGGFRDGPKLYDAKSGHLLRTVNAHDHPISALAFSADGKWVASASFGRIVKLSDSTSGRVHCTFDLHTGNVECVAIHRNGRRIASGGEDKTVRVWDAITGRELLGLHGHTERCSCVAFSPDGLRLVSASADKTIRIWDGTPLSGDEGRQEAFTFTKHTDELRSVAFSPEDHDVHRIASAGGDGIVRLWDAKTGLVNAEFLGHDMFNGRRAVVFSVAWHPKGHLIASSAVDTVRAWNARTAKNIFDLPATTEKFTLPYQALAFSPDGRYLCTGKVNGAVQVWDSENGAVIGTLDTHQQAVRGVAFSKDGEHLAVASSDGFVKLWDAQRLDALLLNEKREARRVLRTRVAGPGLSIAFSPDGRRLATAGERNTVKIWDVQTGQEEKTLWGHKGEVYTLAFSPDKEGRWIASAGEDSTVKIWNSDTGDLVRTFRGHRGIVSSLAFSPDGQRLVSGSRDHTVKVWDLTQLHKE
jgi:WD40 repeat protein